MNGDGRILFHTQELSNSTLFEPHVLTAFHFDWHWSNGQLWVQGYVEERHHVTVWN